MLLKLQGAEVMRVEENDLPRFMGITTPVDR